MNPAMHISDDGLVALERRECSPPDFQPALTAYLDGKGGTWTIGCGHTGAEVHQGMTITMDQARAYLRADLAWAEKAVNDGVNDGIELSQNQFDAVVSFVFNVGVPRWKTSTALKLINRNQLDKVPDAMRLFKYANGDYSKPDPGVVNRRNSECGQFVRGAFVASSTVDVAPEPNWWQRVHNRLIAAGASAGVGAIYDNITADKFDNAAAALQNLSVHSKVFGVAAIALILAGVIWRFVKK